MLAYIGNIGEYREGKEEWSQYAECLNHFLSANSRVKERRFPYCDQTAKITDRKDHRPQAYKLLTSLVTPAKPGEKDYTQLVQVLTQHFDPAPLEIVRRYCFNMRNRCKGETVTVYVLELQGLAQFCNFGGSLDIMLRNHLVCGISDDAIDNL